jgi:hypothetical protein
MSGEELLQKGIPVSIGKAPGVTIIKYQTVSSPKK